MRSLDVLCDICNGLLCNWFLMLKKNVIGNLNLKQCSISNLMRRGICISSRLVLVVWAHHAWSDLGMN